ncbi:ABC transporter substrate-binding protein [Mycolicibacterium sp.]|uniref:ABC transporter substrate-binding protein n=1 Tax=Mycolicibacterium sp. TaxID=2320850 RepID=UPI003D0E6C72
MLVALIVTMLAVACGGRGGDSAVPDGTVVVGVATLQEQQPDPLIANVGSNLYPVKWSVGEFLINRDETGELVPGLAENWEVSPDGLSWTVRLRRDVYMQDGSPFTAADVKTSMDRAVANQGDPLFSGYALWSSVVSTVDVVDEHAIRLTLDRPFSNALVDAPAPIASGYYQRVGEAEFRRKPIAAGPWIFESQKQNDSMSFRRFEGFWDPSRTPTAKRLVLRIIPDETQRVAALQTGQIDIAANLSPASIYQISDGTVDVPDASQANIYFPDLFTGRPGRAADPRVRRALLMAIDRRGIVDVLYGGRGSVANSAFLPTTLGFEPAPDIPYDPDGARSLLAEAGAEGMEFELTTYAASTSVADVQKLAETVVSYWQQAGVKAKLNIVEPATYLANVRAHKYSDAIILCSPGSLLADPSQFSTFFSSQGAYSALKNEGIDRLFRQLDETRTVEDKEAVARELQRELDEKQYSSPLVNTTAVHGVGPRIAEWIPMAGNPVPGPYWTLETT